MGLRGLRKALGEDWKRCKGIGANNYAFGNYWIEWSQDWELWYNPTGFTFDQIDYKLRAQDYRQWVSLGRFSSVEKAKAATEQHMSKEASCQQS